MSKKTVAVGLSGGVDSSVAIAILKKQGYNVVGITMEIWDGAIEVQETAKHACYGPGEHEDVEIATRICEKLDVPYHVFDLTKQYKEHVIEYFRSEYLAGRTPNPCVVCNHKLKFGFLVDKAREAGLEFDVFATGHYARVAKQNGRYVLKKALDTSKDQTYFLSGLRQDQLPYVMFPLGEMTKADARKIAQELGLEVAERAESQDFIAGGDYSPLFDKDEVVPGNIVNDDGKILGKHKGIIHYTIGQRKGLGIAAPKPYYVRKIDAKNNQIIVTDKENLFSEGLIATDLNFSGMDFPTEPVKLLARIRQKHKETEATLIPVDDNKVKVVFDTPQLSVTPGQAVVFYHEDILLGGGIIESPLALNKS